MKSKKHLKHLNENPMFGALRSILLGTVVGAVICAALLGVFALAFVSAGHIPQNLISPMMLGLSVLASFVAGFVTAKISRKRGLAYGALSGLLLFVLFLVSGMIASHEPVSLTAGIRMLVMVLSGAIGGLLAVSKKSKVK
ncbi:TIGR04086 family membrane protein [Caproiciproducens sp. CPB-2]|uniref:TIGR04086 family membrane protein n=1 Tax=Caproiciproducens sp. CPB-2 TaxID=3030017 RepID=UPI0023DC42B0|nr:TIGR04086 family membrane protein [Caproiciproducens sp. CPB-2]MDF1495113.1 TIGR04086 family membrane protein [Caproiciproducens sp. CPB-2]